MQKRHKTAQIVVCLLLHVDNPAIVKYDQMRWEVILLGALGQTFSRGRARYDAAGKRYLKYLSPAPTACLSHQMRRVTRQWTVVP